MGNLVLGLINTLELLFTIPTIVFVMSVILFWNNIKKTNELIIIRHYLSFKKLILILSLSIISFSYLEINKSHFTNKITSLKENFLKKSSNNENIQKVFFQFDEDQLTITRLDGLNIISQSIEGVSVYKFKNDIFFNSLYSNDNEIFNDKIVMKNPKIITGESISDLGKDYKISLVQFGEYFYDNSEKININNKNTSIKTESLFKKIILIIILFTYFSVFISKKGIQKNASVLKYTSIAIILFTYSFVTSQTYLENYNNLFQISVLLTFTFYLYKNLANE
ncbi:MAG: hypothetical protein P8J53_02195 [Alphaproteobacteria bacterium]|nr:hypothetical protein [Alphaproteobacteria bacterium]